MFKIFAAFAFLRTYTGDHQLSVNKKTFRYLSFNLYTLSVYWEDVSKYHLQHKPLHPVPCF